MRDKILLALVFSVMILLVCCATTTQIPVKVLKPSELDIGRVEKGAVFAGYIQSKTIYK